MAGRPQCYPGRPGGWVGCRGAMPDGRTGGTAPDHPCRCIPPPSSFAIRPQAGRRGQAAQKPPQGLYGPLSGDRLQYAKGQDKPQRPAGEGVAGKTTPIPSRSQKTKVRFPANGDFSNDQLIIEIPAIGCYKALFSPWAALWANQSEGEVRATKHARYRETGPQSQPKQQIQRHPHVFSPTHVGAVAEHPAKGNGGDFGVFPTFRASTVHAAVLRVHKF